MKKSRRAVGTVWGGAVLAVVALLVTAAGALAAAHFAPNRQYTAKSPSCRPHAIPNTSCTFVFKASSDGHALRSVGKSVVDAWSCHNGGGEALLGGKAQFATPIPVISVGRDGTVSGSVSYVFRPTSAPPEHHTYTVSGRISPSGRSATIILHDHYQAAGSRGQCTVGPVTLTESGH